MVHVKKLERVKEIIGTLTHPELLHVLLGRKILLDNGTDNRCRSQKDQYSDRQFERTEKIPQTIHGVALLAQVFSPDRERPEPGHTPKQFMLKVGGIPCKTEANLKSTPY
jgi:hypothetical protein